MWRVLAVAAATLAAAAAATAAPVRMRYPEGPAHGFLVVSDERGATIAHGELIQWLERTRVASRLVIRFDDGSRYDETVRFTQRPVFRIVAYHLVQRGPSFPETTEASFDRSRYHARRRAAPDAPEERAAGPIDLPDDVSNGLASVLLKNLPPGASASVHFVTFRPKPRVLDMHLVPEGTDRFTIGPASEDATRFLVKPEVGGALGIVASLAGKQPPSLRMWIATGQAPTLVRVDGPLYADGPPWRIELAAPRWGPSALAPAGGSR